MSWLERFFLNEYFILRPGADKAVARKTGMGSVWLTTASKVLGDMVAPESR